MDQLDGARTVTNVDDQMMLVQQRSGNNHQLAWIQILFLSEQRRATEVSTAGGCEPARCVHKTEDSSQ